MLTHSFGDVLDAKTLTGKSKKFLILLPSGRNMILLQNKEMTERATPFSCNTNKTLSICVNLFISR